ncbi:MAG: hypothetical protein HY234_13960 [Acidobacteria bacterium]|nr:hypothetical protein [Acidobacteriota bacterium]
MRRMNNMEAEMRFREQRIAVRFFILALVFILLALIIPALRAAAAQQAAPAGTVEFVARATPTGGRAEPVMRLGVSLLRKSFADIQKEAEQSEAKPELDKFIEGLQVSKELKAWMKRTRSVELSGNEFARRVTTKDIFEVPEFFEAYMARNAGDATLGFPVTKARDKDRSENPARYEKAQKDYREALRKFIEEKPYTRDGMEVELANINPGPRWVAQEGERKRRVRDRALALAETTYLAAKTETDLEGRGAFAGVPAGDYWLSTIEGEATVGDARLRWDVAVPVRAGRVTRVPLTNVNAVRKGRD